MQEKEEKTRFSEGNIIKITEKDYVDMTIRSSNFGKILSTLNFITDYTL